MPNQPLTHLSSPQPGVRSERRGVHRHRLSAHAQAVRFRGIRVSSPEQTFIDLACVLSLVDLVVLGDSLVKARRTTVDSTPTTTSSGTTILIAAKSWTATAGE